MGSLVFIQNYPVLTQAQIIFINLLGSGKERAVTGSV
jgi:hypothetical protein